MNHDFEIAYLADHPDLVPLFASWICKEWGDQYCNGSVDQIAVELSKNMNKDRIPLTLVGLCDSKAIGTASLNIKEMTTHQHLLHWLGGVYLTEQSRNQGIGTKLVERTTQEARKLKLGALYLSQYSRQRALLRSARLDANRKTDL